jgi:FMN phosphatase YigB (HAD superfamily)
MKIRAVIFDVYRTLLDVGPPPADADEQWNALWLDQLRVPARISLQEFLVACEAVIAREHASARRAGIPFPEVFWNGVTTEVLPELAELSDRERDDFLFGHARLLRSLRLAPGAEETLRALRDTGTLLGIASNAQPYTLRELDEALVPAGLDRELFTPGLCFWSFEHGFSKPDPHVFRILTAGLGLCGISHSSTLMVGDRIDNDIEPSLAQGWQAWHLDSNACDAMRGGWGRLQEWMKPRI